MEFTRTEGPDYEYNVHFNRRRNGYFSVTMKLDNLDEADILKLAMYAQLGDHPALNNLLITGLARMLGPEKAKELQPVQDALRESEWALISEALAMR